MIPVLADPLWLGPQTYAETDAHRFFGRTAERDELLDLIRRESFFLLHGESGHGKSSLLQAGLAPELRRQGAFPIILRDLFRDDVADITVALLTAITQQAAQLGYRAPSYQEGDTLWEYFHRTGGPFTSQDREILIPVIILDQFEDVFRRCQWHPGEKDTPAARFLTEFADLVENREPAHVRQSRLENGHTDFDSAPIALRVLIALREDALPDLTPLRATIPGLARIHYRLRPLTRASAREVILRPVAGSPAHSGLFGENPSVLAEDILTRMAAGPVSGEAPTLQSVDPFLLSVVMDQLQRSAVISQPPVVTHALVRDGVAAALDAFYETAVALVPVSLRDWLETTAGLVTAGGFRNSIAADDAEHALRDPTTSAHLRTLENAHLLRAEPRPDGSLRYELVHDRLCAVLAGKIRLREEIQAEKERLHLEAQAENERRRANLLDKARKRALVVATIAIACAILAVLLFLQTRELRLLAVTAEAKFSEAKSKFDQLFAILDKTAATEPSSEQIKEIENLQTKLKNQRREGLFGEMLLRSLSEQELSELKKLTIALGESDEARGFMTEILCLMWEIENEYERVGIDHLRVAARKAERMLGKIEAKKDEPSLAALDLRQLERRLRFRLGRLHGEISNLSRGSDRAAAIATGEAMFDRAFEISKTEKVEPPVKEKIQSFSLRGYGKFYVSINNLEMATLKYKEAIAVTRKPFEQWPDDANWRYERSWALIDLICLFYEKGNFDSFIDMSGEYIDVHENMITVDPARKQSLLDAAWGYCRLGQSLEVKGRSIEAKKAYARWRSLALTAFQESPKDQTQDVIDKLFFRHLIGIPSVLTDDWSKGNAEFRSVVSTFCKEVNVELRKLIEACDSSDLKVLSQLRLAQLTAIVGESALVADKRTGLKDQIDGLMKRNEILLENESISNAGDLEIIWRISEVYESWGRAWDPDENGGWLESSRDKAIFLYGKSLAVLKKNELTLQSNTWAWDQRSELHSRLAKNQQALHLGSSDEDSGDPISNAKTSVMNEYLESVRCGEQAVMLDPKTQRYRDSLQSRSYDAGSFAQNLCGDFEQSAAIFCRRLKMSVVEYEYGNTQWADRQVLVNALWILSSIREAQTDEILPKGLDVKSLLWTPLRKTITGSEYGPAIFEMCELFLRMLNDDVAAKFARDGLNGISPVNELIRLKPLLESKGNQLAGEQKAKLPDLIFRINRRLAENKVR